MTAPVPPKPRKPRRSGTSGRGLKINATSIKLACDDFWRRRGIDPASFAANSNPKTTQQPS